jgi:hypothetical protein
MKKIILMLSLVLPLSGICQLIWDKNLNNAMPPGSLPMIGTNYNAQFQIHTATLERMRAFQNGLSPSCPGGGGVGIHFNSSFPITVPGSLLHLGLPVNIGGGILPASNGLAGWRRWMQIGTFSYADTDNMYVGLKSELVPVNPNEPGSKQQNATIASTCDRLDAVIAWGDNVAGAFNGQCGALGPDYLRVIFNGTYSPGATAGMPSDINGMEVTRFSPTGNVGIGNYQNWPIPIPNHSFLMEPARRLEVLSDKANANAMGNPQFRITHTPTNIANMTPAGKYTDFHTTNAGDLNIDPEDISIGAVLLQDRYVGIHTNTPGNSLEINGQLAGPLVNNPAVPASWPASTGASGLRFKDLTSGSTPVPNGTGGVNNNKVLTVDQNGDVVLTTAGGGVPVIANNGLQVGPGGFVQLGGNCTVTSEIIAAQLLTDRDVSLVDPTNPNPPANQHNLWFSGIPSTAATGPGGRVGIGIKTSCMPGNRLEIFNNVTGSNVSGLRLTDLSTLPVPMANPGTGVLSVDFNGDVIYVPAGGAGPTIGGYCPSPPANGLSNNFEIPLNIFGYNFTTPNNSPGQVNIGGAPGCGAFPARLNVTDDNIGNGIYGFCSTTTSDDIGVRGSVFAGAPSSPFANVGVLGETNSSNYKYGYAGVAGYVGPANLTTLPFGQPIGVYGNGMSISSGWAGWFDGRTGFNGNAIPIGPPCSWNLGLPGSEWNEVWACNGLIQTSDVRKKQNIQALNYGIKEIMQLKPVSYNWSTNPNAGNKIGFIAQQVKEIIPEVVHVGTDENQTHGMNYAELTALLVKGMQEQQNEINELKSVIASLVSGTTTENKTTNSQSIDLSDKNTIVLDQNVPNPFAESTVINYNIPTDFVKAQIIFSTSDGKVIRSVDIATKGPGKLNVFANDLSSGMYSYSLVVDGKTIDTKKMVKN